MLILSFWPILAWLYSQLEIKHLMDIYNLDTTIEIIMQKMVY